MPAVWYSPGMETITYKQAYRIVRRRNPQIAAWRAFEYVKTLDRAGTLSAAFPEG